MTDGSLKLSAEDIDGLTVISACLQDAVTHGTEFVYQPKQHRFAATFSRFMWERSVGKTLPHNLRIRTGLHFDGVLAVRFRKLNRDAEQILELLSIVGQTGDDGAAMIVLEFAGDSAIQLEVECVACYLSDIGKPWQASRRPDHDLDPE